MMEGARPSSHGPNKYNFCPCRGSDEIMNYYLNSGQSKKVEEFVYVLRTRLLQFLEALASQPDKSMLKAHEHLPKRLTAQVMEWPSLVEDCRSDSIWRIVYDLTFNWPVLQQLILSLSIPKEIPCVEGEAVRLKNGGGAPSKVLAVAPPQPPIHNMPLSLADSISKIENKMLKEVLGTLEFYDVSSSPYSERDYVLSHSEVSSDAEFYFDPSFLKEEVVLPKHKDNYENTRIGALIDGVSHMSFSNMVDLCSPPLESKDNSNPPPESAPSDKEPPVTNVNKKPSDVIPPAPAIPPANRRYLHLREKLRWRMRLRHAEMRKSTNNVKEDSQVDTPKDIEDVVNFIEGKNKVVNEKRLAKKARQREKKLKALEEQRKAEEEAARKLEEEYQLQMQREAARAKKKKKKESRMKKLANAQPVPKPPPQVSKPTLIGSRDSNFTSTIIENKDSGTVTIRRVGLPQKNPSTVTISFSASDDNISRIIGMLKSGPFNSPSVEVQKSHAPSPMSVFSCPPKATLTAQKSSPPSAPPPVAKPPQKTARPLQDPNTIKINQIVARMAQSPDASSFGDIQLPSGITISRVDPGKVRSEFPIGTASRTFSETTCEPKHQIINVTTNRQRCDEPVPHTSSTLVHPVETKAKNKRRKK